MKYSVAWPLSLQLKQCRWKASSSSRQRGFWIAHDACPPNSGSEGCGPPHQGSFHEDNPSAEKKRHLNAEYSVTVGSRSKNPIHFLHGQLIFNKYLQTFRDRYTVIYDIVYGLYMLLLKSLANKFLVKTILPIILQRNLHQSDIWLCMVKQCICINVLK